MTRHARRGGVWRRVLGRIAGHSRQLDASIHKRRRAMSGRTRPVRGCTWLARVADLAAPTTTSESGAGSRERSAESKAAARGRPSMRDGGLRLRRLTGCGLRQPCLPSHSRSLHRHANLIRRRFARSGKPPTPVIEKTGARRRRCAFGSSVGSVMGIACCWALSWNFEGQWLWSSTTSASGWW